MSALTKPGRLYFTGKDKTTTKPARFVPIFIAIVYAVALTSLPVDVFKDRANYFVYADYSDLILNSYIIEGSLAVLGNEPLWLLANWALSYLFYSDQTVRVFIFFPSFLISWKLLARNPKHIIWMLVFLLSPQVIKNHIIHLRQGAALAVFLTGYYAKPTWLRLSLMGMAGFIHSSFLIISAIGLAAWGCSKLRLPPKVRTTVLIVAVAIIGGMIGVVAGSIDARQATEYADASLNISGAGFVFWALMFLLFFSSGSRFLNDGSFAVANLAFYLSVYFISPVAGRIFESGLFIVYQAAFALEGWRQRTFLGAFLVYSVLQYSLQLGSPWLGWGVFA